MSRKSTLSKEWTKLLELAGGVAAVCDAIGMSQTAFYRATRGQAEFPPEKRETLQIFCNLLSDKHDTNVENPLDHGPKPWCNDLTSLRMLGDALARGFPVSKRTVDKLRSIYPDDQLIKLAESDAPESILRAAASLLEDA